jgi:predicted nucleic acid-binding protein
VVVDAAAIVDLLMVNQPKAGWVEAELAKSQTLDAPHLLDMEVISGFRKAVLRGNITLERARLALDNLAESPIRRYPVTDLLERILDLSDTLTAYDASYVALAEALDAPLITTDERLARSTGHMAQILSPA